MSNNNLDWFNKAQDGKSPAGILQTLVNSYGQLVRRLNYLGIPYLCGSKLVRIQFP